MDTLRSQAHHPQFTKNYRSVSFRLRLMLISMVILSFVLMFIVLHKKVTDIAARDEMETIKIIARAKAAEVGEWLAGANNMLKAYAETEAMKSDDWDVIQPLLMKAYDRMADNRYLFLAYVRANGEGWTSRGKYLDARPLPYFKPIIGNNEPYYVTNPFVGATTNAALIIIGHGIRNAEGKNQGIMIAGVDGSSISTIAEKITIGDVGYGTIVDNSGVFVAHPDVEKVMKLNIKELDKQGFSGMTEIGSDMINQVENVRKFTRNGEAFFMVYVPIPHSPKWTLGIVIPSWYFNRLTISITKSMLPFFIPFVIIIVVITLMVTHRISSSLRQTSSALRDIAQGDGDLTVALQVKGNDELSAIAYYFNQTIAKIADSVKSVGKGTNLMKAIGEELSDNMVTAADAVAHITANIDSMKQETVLHSQSVEATAAAMKEMIGSIQALDSSIKDQCAHVTKSFGSVEQMAGNVYSVTKILKNNKDVLMQLEEKSEHTKRSAMEIAKVTQEISSESESLLEASNVIQHIASQTNLLAMNAAIEAAHAGEAGKGFAVVSDEIRKLSEESSMQGKNITAVLKNLKARIDKIALDSAKAEHIFEEAFELTEVLKQEEEGIMAAMAAQTEGSDHILKAMSDVQVVADQVKKGSADMLTVSGKVSEELEKLSAITDTMTSEMNKIAESAVKINTAVDEVNEITKQNKEHIAILAGEVGKFKV